MLEHALHLLLLLAIWAAPLPLCAWLSTREDEESFYGQDLLLLIATWIGCQMTLPLLLGAFGVLHAPGVYVGEGLFLIVGLALHRLRPSRALRLLPRQAPNSFELGMLFFAIVTLGLSFWVLLRVPTSNYDSFAYHLPAMIWWAQHGRFEFLPDLLHAAYYAFDWEVASLLSIYPMRSDLFLAVPNLVAWAMSGLGAMLLARRLGAARDGAMAAALLFLSMPAVLSRLDAAQPDLVLCAFFLAAIHLGLGALQNGSTWSWGLALWCVLILPGLKMSGLVYAPMALVAIFALHWSRGGRWREMPWHLQKQLPLLLWGLFLGAFWYGRNLGINGNPFGFLQIELFGSVLFEGDQTREELARTALTQVFQLGEAEDWRTLYAVLWDKLGPAFAILLLGALASLRQLPRRTALVFLGLGLWALFAYWSAPYSGDNGSRDYQFTAWFGVGLRYAYPLFALVAVGAALGFPKLRVGSRLGLLLVMATGLFTLAWKLKSGGVAMRWSVGVGLVLCGLWSLRQRLPMRPTLAGLAVIAFVLLAWQSHRLDEQRDTQRQKQYGFLHAFMESEIGEDQVIGYARTHRRYQLFGNSLAREVICVDAQLDDIDQWLRQLREADIDLLAVGTADNAEIARKGLPDVRKWIAQEPRRFELLFPAQSELKDLALYRVRLDPGRGAN